MGSKKLKAIAVRGTRRTEVANPDALEDFALEFSKSIRENPALGGAYRKYGTANLVNITNVHGVFPTRYWYKGQFERYEEINAETLLDRLWVANRSCFMCPIGCGKRTKVREGPYAGTRLEGPDYETLFAFGGLCELASIEAIAKINEVCDRLGLDTITAGNVVAFAIEAYKRGKLQSHLPLRYGDAEVVLHLLEQIAYRNGIGFILAEGTKNASELLGLPELAIHVKGLEPAGYDPRGLKGMGLAYAVSSRGACHLRSTEYIYELRGVVSPFTTQGKASLVKEYEDRFAIFDSLILCRFIRDVCDWGVLSQICQLTTGLDVDEVKLRTIAERIVTLSRLFNTRMGISRKDDCLPRRFMEEPLQEGPAKGQVVSNADMDQMLEEYYQLRGWDNNGIPTRRKTKDLLLP